MKKLKDICYLLNGYSFKSSNYKSLGYRIIRITNVQKGLIEDKNPVFYEYDIKLKKYELIQNDLLISLTGNVGRVGIVTNNILPAYLNQRVGCLRIKNSDILPQYLYYILNTSKFELDCIRASNGIAQLNLSAEWLKEYEIEIPSIEKQKEIIHKMNLISNNIEIRKKQIKICNELIKSQFVEMFGDPVINEKKWNRYKLNELGYFGRGVSKHRPRNAIELLNGPYPLIQTGDVSNSDLYIKKYLSTYSELGLKQSKMWPCGTLCITIAANIAQTSILTFDACFPDSVVGFIANEKTNNIFMHYWFSFLQKIIDSKASQVAQKNINLQILSELGVINPPIELQNRFAQIVEQIDKQKYEMEKSLKKLEEMQSALMQEYFG